MIFDSNGREISPPVHIAVFVLLLAVGGVGGAFLADRVARLIIEVVGIPPGNGQAVARLGFIAFGLIALPWALVQQRQQQRREWDGAYAKAYAPVMPGPGSTPIKPAMADIERVEYFPDLSTTTDAGTETQFVTRERPGVFNASIIASASERPAPDIENPDLIAAFVGPNASVIVPKLLRARDAKFAWNWPAFFLGPAYLAYRGMYGWFVGVCGVIVAAEVIEAFVSRSLAALNFGIGFALGGGFYRLYWKHYKLKYAETIRETSNQHAIEALKSMGGVNLVAAIAGTLALLAALVVVGDAF